MLVCQFSRDKRNYDPVVEFARQAECAKGGDHDLRCTAPERHGQAPLRDASAALEVASRHSCCQRHSFCSSSVMWWDAGREVWREGSEERERRKRVEEGGLFL